MQLWLTYCAVCPCSRPLSCSSRRAELPPHSLARRQHRVCQIFAMQTRKQLAFSTLFCFWNNHDKRVRRAWQEMHNWLCTRYDTTHFYTGNLKPESALGLASNLIVRCAVRALSRCGTKASALPFHHKHKSWSVYRQSWMAQEFSKAKNQGGKNPG